MGLTAAQVVTGPALVTVNSKKHSAAGNVAIGFSPVLSPITTALDGTIKHSITRHDVRASYTPDERWTTDMRATLFPYLSTRRGAVITAQAWRFDGVDEQIHQVLAGVLTKMPEINFGVDAPRYGSVEVTGLCVSGLDPADAASYYSVALTGGSVADSAFSPDDFARGNFKLTWGSIFTDIEAQNGWRVTPTLNVNVHTVAGVPRKITFESLEATVSGVPVGIDSDDILTALKLQNDAAVIPGRNTGALAAALTIELGSTPYFYAAKAALVGSGYAFGSDVLRDGEITFQLVRDFTTGTPAALWSWTAP